MIKIKIKTIFYNGSTYDVMKDEITGETYLETLSKISNKKIIIHFNSSNDKVNKFQELARQLVYEMY